MALFNKPRIVSVSRRTGIPAFYWKLFMQRVRQGWLVSCNPFSRRAVRVSLGPEDVGTFIWTLTVYGALLREAGSGPVYPFVLATAAGGGDLE